MNQKTYEPNKILKVIYVITNKKLLILYIKKCCILFFDNHHDIYNNGVLDSHVKKTAPNQ